MKAMEDLLDKESGDVPQKAGTPALGLPALAPGMRDGAALRS